MEILKIANLAKSFYLHYPGLEIKSCQKINLTLHKGEFIGIVGLSGAGKSTILKCINRTYLPTQGDIIYNSEAFGEINLAEASEQEIIYLRRHEIGYVTQFLNVMPRTTAKEHVMNALSDMGISAGFAEMFLQNMPDGGIHILPALPASWVKGRITGLRAKGLVSVDISWDEEKINIVLHSSIKKTLTVHCQGQEREVNVQAGNELCVKIF